MSSFAASLKVVAQELGKARGRADLGLVARVEDEVRRDARCLELDAAGFATLRAAGHTWAAGRFETPTLAELERRVAALPRRPGAKVTLSVLSGSSALTDIGTLQGFADPGSLFQVASQFDCLEATDPAVVPVADYLRDPTQGPRASISAFPGTFLRHYAAPRDDGSRFVQSAREQLNLLQHFCRPGVASVNCGYLLTEDVTRPAAFARALVDEFEQLRVGVHEGVEVVFGSNWGGPVRQPAPRIAQVFTSTWAGGGYSQGTLGEHHRAVLQQLQRGAYLGTLLAAASLGCRRVVTTLIGGGVFDNPADLIWDAILWAVARVQSVAPAPLEVVVNARGGIDPSRDEVVRALVVETGGELVTP